MEDRFNFHKNSDLGFSDLDFLVSPLFITYTVEILLRMESPALHSLLIYSCDFAQLIM